MSISVLKALPGKLDIKRHSPSILFICFIPSISQNETLSTCWKWFTFYYKIFVIVYKIKKWFKRFLFGVLVLIQILNAALLLGQLVIKGANLTLTNFVEMPVPSWYSWHVTNDLSVHVGNLVYLCLINQLGVISPFFKIMRCLVWFCTVRLCPI